MLVDIQQPFDEEMLDSGMNPNVRDESDGLFSFVQALALLEDGQEITRQAWQGRATLVIHREQAPRESFVLKKTDEGRYEPWLSPQIDVLAKDWMLPLATVKPPVS